jgi:dolichol-phosphate mannosyltransferase
MPEGSSSQRGLPSSGLPSSGLPSVTVIVPTYREALNIPLLLDRIAKVREQHSLELNVLIMDDDSADGSVQAVEAFGEGWVEIVVRTHNRGLSLAVVDGLARATGDVVLIMDADLSHPPEKIADLLTALQTGQQGALGSRYVRGGSTDVQWGIFRWLNSRVATLLARPLTRVHDPMAGFFAMWRRDLAGADLNPVGYKIALELIVRCGVDDIAEIPIHFTDRQYGDSKLSFRQQLLYLLHLRRLYAHKFGR